jgi:hypothetical protein
MTNASQSQYFVSVRNASFVLFSFFFASTAVLAVSGDEAAAQQDASVVEASEGEEAFDAIRSLDQAHRQLSDKINVVLPTVEFKPVPKIAASKKGAHERSDIAKSIAKRITVSRKVLSHLWAILEPVRGVESELSPEVASKAEKLETFYLSGLEDDLILLQKIDHYTGYRPFPNYFPCTRLRSEWMTKMGYFTSDAVRLQVAKERYAELTGAIRGHVDVAVNENLGLGETAVSWRTELYEALGVQRLEARGQQRPEVP